MAGESPAAEAHFVRRTAMRSVNWKVCFLTTFLAACGHQGLPRLPAPEVFLHCFTLTAGKWTAFHPEPEPQLPRAINLGTTKQRRGRLSPLQVGTLVPDTGDTRVLWRLAAPDSLIIAFVPASTGIALMSGLTLYARVNDTLLVGKAVFWSDEVGPEMSVPVMGRWVSCPAGA